MRARELPGAAAFGLIASLLAHAAGYGSGHAMGGSYHELLLVLSALALLGGALAVGALAWAGAGRTQEGSILAARLKTAVPSWPALTVAAASWLMLVEHLEPRHYALSPLLLLAMVALAAWLLLVLARFALALLAAAAVAVRRGRFAQRPLAWRIRACPTPTVSRIPRAARRYARPPPSAVLGA
ncbi:MAG: hypothetical protein ACYC8W_07605 [Candidatus Tyrphobacter sp.]